MVTALANTTTELLKKMPDYDQKLKKRWNDLHRLYNIEISKPRDDWDADLLLNLRKEIQIQNANITKASQNA